MHTQKKSNHQAHQDHQGFIKPLLRALRVFVIHLIVMPASGGHPERNTQTNRGFIKNLLADFPVIARNEMTKQSSFFIKNFVSSCTSWFKYFLERTIYVSCKINGLPTPTPRFFANELIRATPSPLNLYEQTKGN